MKKLRKLGFLGIMSVLAVVMILAGLSFVQAQAPTKGKPVRPPEATWAVRVPTSGMFYGMTPDGYYENNSASIKVSVKKEWPGAWKRYYGFVYTFDFTLTNDNVGTVNPPAYQVGFQGVGDLYDIDTSNPDQDKPSCRFPVGGSAAPDCLAGFLNNTHPYSEAGNDYQYFWTRVDVFDQDIELMGIGESYLFGSASDPGEPGDHFEMVARYRESCSPEPAFHDVEIDRFINYSRALELKNPLNIKIERLDATAYAGEYGLACEAVWRIHILPVSIVPIDGQFITGFLNVKERYCTIEKNRTKWYYPLVAKGCFDFYIDFIKNPTAK